jgi:type IV secretory pathway TrbL component
MGTAAQKINTSSSNAAKSIQKLVLLKFSPKSIHHNWHIAHVMLLLSCALIILKVEH